MTRAAFKIRSGFGSDYNTINRTAAIGYSLYRLTCTLTSSLGSYTNRPRSIHTQCHAWTSPISSTRTIECPLTMSQAVVARSVRAGMRKRLQAPKRTWCCVHFHVQRMIFVPAGALSGKIAAKASSYPQRAAIANAATAESSFSRMRQKSVVKLRWQPSVPWMPSITASPRPRCFARVGLHRPMARRRVKYTPSFSSHYARRSFRSAFSRQTYSDAATASHVRDAR